MRQEMRQARCFDYAAAMPISPATTRAAVRLVRSPPELKCAARFPAVSPAHYCSAAPVQKVDGRTA